MEMKIKTPAKVNLFLEIGARREDGYHDLRSVMQTVSLFDRLTVRCNKSVRTKILVRSNSFFLPTGEKNIAFQAASLFHDRFLSGHYEISVFLEKHIPVCAGLGGGSADAAGVLYALNRMFPGKAKQEELYPLAAALGSDVPFCLKKGTALANGRGEKLSPLPPLPSCRIVIAIENERVSTAAAYAAFDALPHGEEETALAETRYRALLRGLETGDPAAVAKNLYNSFEASVFPSAPRAKRIKEELLEAGALGALLSGSGAAVFGICSAEDAHRIADKLKKPGRRVFVCAPEEEI
ncbi:MAG: 4-(cytidine 5'-diphospho)-2-C-methyl-D-erythritol kinase [Clostridia bacterium]|nr:4-(cytidine 5'-diphospho)-2-C-methyl-D-erythritol kinase [Clostridia bacterium]